MKGITPVIAVILLLIITISMVGFAFVWFQRVAFTAQTATESTLQTTLTQQGQTIRIDNVEYSTNKVQIRSIGTQSILNSNLNVYLNGTKQTCAWDSPSLAPGSIITCTFGTGCASGSGTKLRVTSPGNLDEVVC